MGSKKSAHLLFKKKGRRGPGYWFRSGPGLFLFIFLTFASPPVHRVAAAGPEPQTQEKIEAQVLEELHNKGRVTFWILLQEQADTRFAVNISDWDARGQAVFTALHARAERTQAPILERLVAASAEATSFWIINTIQVTTHDESLIRELAARPDVATIKAEERWQIPEPIPSSEELKIQAVEWGVARIRAPEVWQQFHVRGEGIVVANIDTGVQYNHPALVRQYRGRRPDGTFDHNYNWFDPSQVCGSPSRVPCDNDGHGTHTMGTLVGDDGGVNQIGVAPRAQWIAAKGCESRNCSSNALLASGQWVLAPTDLNGQNPRPDLRPHVVNNSWGDTNPCDSFFRLIVLTWRNAGIFPAFANGNAGPFCGTVGVPGAYPESFGVGATDIGDNIANFSSRGPALCFGFILKPQASAPGVNVRSSLPGNSYGLMSGTSMATPHVAGAVALLWSARPNLRGATTATFEILQRTARARLSFWCGPPGPPNNVYGWGIIDAFQAVQEREPPPSRLKCLGNTCTRVAEAGPNECPQEGVGCTRLKCVSNTCTRVAEAGPNECPQEGQRCGLCGQWSPGDQCLPQCR